MANELEIEGKLHLVYPVQTGTGKNGEWKKQQFIIDVPGQYPKKVACVAWGDKTATVSNMSIGQNVKVTFEPESREYQDKWYTDLKAYKIFQTGTIIPPPIVNNQAATNTALPIKTSNPTVNNGQEEEDDLPF